MGHARIHRSARERCALVESVLIAKDARRRGFGRRLVAEAEAACRERGVDTVHLNTFDQFDFYVALGYQRYVQGEAPPDKAVNVVMGVKRAPQKEGAPVRVWYSKTVKGS